MESQGIESLIELINRIKVTDDNEADVDLMKELIDEKRYTEVIPILNKLKNEKEDLMLIINKSVDTSEKDKECDRLVKEFLNLEKPSRSIMLELINRIEIHKDKTIDIHFNFKKLNFLLKENHH